MVYRESDNQIKSGVWRFSFLPNSQRWYISAINSAIWHSENTSLAVNMITGLKKP